MADFSATDILYDMCQTQKALAKAYCDAALECSDRSLAKQLMGLCAQQQEMAFDICEAIKKQGAQTDELTEISQLENAVNGVKQDKAEM